MHFAWDERKNKINQYKHSLSFELAMYVFEDTHLLTWLDPNNHYEERWISLGCIENFILIVIIYTIRSHDDGQEIIRIISARKATKNEREIYFKNKQ